ncbi:MAG: 2-oxoacid:acceptor oxidoreductase subunit alpha [Planctomycetota bacterium]
MKFLQGNIACVEGALKAGCDFYAGYPITPSSEIMNAMARRMPARGGTFVQMEDEIASIAAVIGASWTGAKAMTATSGPGLTLMLENIGYAYATETPCVIVDVQRCGPSTGQATRPGQGDVMQPRFGASGDYEAIALAPWSVQEMFEMTARAFALAQEYRRPVFVLTDELIAHLREMVNLDVPIEPVDPIAVSDRPPFGDEKTCEPTPMPRFGTGRKLLVTGSTHDEWGYRRTTDSAVQARLVERITGKVVRDRAKLAEVEQYNTDDAEVVLVSFGCSARSSHAAMRLAREEGRKVGLLRLKTLWPFAQEKIREISGSAKKLVVVEMNRGMMRREVERFSSAEVIGCHKTAGEPIRPMEILEVIKDACA